MKKTVEQHRRDGTYRHDRHGEKVELQHEVPEPPKYLPKRARKYWNDLAVVCEQMPAVAVTDQSVMAMWCIAMADWQAAEDDIEKNGRVVLSPKGMISNPAINHQANAWRRVLEASRDLGFTPRHRDKVSKLKSGKGAKQSEAGRKTKASSPKLDNVISL